MKRLLALLMLLVLASPASAQTFPKLAGRVVDAANILPPADEATISTKLEALETASTRQLVVATLPDLEGRDLEDYGFRLGRAWGIGQKGADNGAILIVAPTERRVRIEVGPGLQGVLTDAVSSLIIQNQITPAFKAGDYPGGINAGVDAIVAQLQAPPEVAERAAIEAANARRQAQAGRSRGNGGGSSIMPLLFWGAVFLFVILPMLRGASGGGRRYGGGAAARRRGGGMDPVSSILLWELASAAARGGGNSGWGGGGGGFGGGGGIDFGGGGGGFSGGGGGFDGGGASGSW